MRNENLFYWLIFVLFSAALFTGCAETSVVKTVSTNTNSSNVVNEVTKTVPAADVRVYEGKGDYRTPEGMEDYKVKISTNNGLITDFSFVSGTRESQSIEYQALFLDGVKTLIVGKPLKDLKALDRVNGASLTTGGFNKALTEIQAKMNS